MKHPQYLGGDYRSTKPLPNWQMCLGMIPVFLIGWPAVMLWVMCTTKRGRR
jgi:hypothetical protein